MSSPDKLKEDGAMLVMDIVRLIRNGKNDAAIDHAAAALRQARAEAIEECANLLRDCIVSEKSGASISSRTNEILAKAETAIRALTSAHKGGE